jgi:hypothetical protein
MAKAEITATRAPRGAKPVSQAFFTALESLPDAARTAVARAAQVMIRDELKARRDKVKAAAIKEKARQPATAKTEAPKARAKAVAAPTKRRPRKQVGIPAAA